MRMVLPVSVTVKATTDSVGVVLGRSSPRSYDRRTDGSIEAAVFANTLHEMESRA